MNPSAIRAALGRHLAAASEQDRRSARSERRRCEVHGASLVLEGLAREGRPQYADHVGDPATSFAHRHVEESELLAHVAAGDDQVDPSPAEDVEHDQVLG